MPRPLRPTLPLAGALVAAATIAFGLLYEATVAQLGTATPPFVMAFGVEVHPLAVLSVLAAGVAPLVVPRLLAVRSPALFALGAYALALGLGLALNLARDGTDGWTEVFDLGPGGSFEAKNEYLPGLPALDYGARFFLDRFAELVPALPVNVAGHTPGLILVMHGLGITEAGQLAALCVGVGALTAPLTFLLAREVPGADDERARVAALLAACSPALLLIGVTSADFLYAAVGALAAWLLLRAPPLGVVAAALAAFFSYALLAMAAWATLVTWRRDGVRAAVVLAVGCALAVGALAAGLAALTGYDAPGALRATNAVYEESLARVRPYWFWVVGSPVAWAVMAGLPTAWLLLRAVAVRDTAALAVAAIVVTAAVLGFTKAETERIWLPFVPLACVAAAAVLPARRLPGVVALLVAQALVCELLFATIW